MLKEIIHLDDEAEARRILMRLGNGLPQVDSLILEWRAAKEEAMPVVKVAPVVTQKVVTNTKIEKVVVAPTQIKVEDAE
jgi:NAD-dependent DNA ligase